MLPQSIINIGEASILVEERNNHGPYLVVFHGGNLAVGLYFCRLDGAALVEMEEIMLDEQHS